MQQAAQVPGSGNLTVQIGRDLNVGEGATVDFVVGDRPRLDLVLEREVGTGPLAPLNPYGRAIDLLGRDSEKRALWEWLERADHRFSVRVLTGRAGTGKTRLAIELCHEAVAREWQAGFVGKDEIAWFLDHFRTVDWVWGKPTLIVIDYAAQRPELLRRLTVGLAQASGKTPRPPLRLLLLERFADNNSGWWQQVFGLATFTERPADFLDPAEPVELPGLADPETRRAIFSAALGSAAPQAGADRRFDQRLVEITWGGQPLFLAMAGLLAAERGVDSVLALNRADLALAVAERELARQHDLAQGQGRVRAELLCHMVAFVTLCGGAPTEDLEAIVDREKSALHRSSAGDPPDVVGLLRQALPVERKRSPGGSPTETEMLQPVLPDVIGEAILLMQFSGLADRGASAILRAFGLAPLGVIAMALRTGQDFGGEKHAQLWGRWIRALLEGPATDPNVLLFIGDQWPRFSTALGNLAAEVAEKVVGVWRQRQGADPAASAALANALNTFGVRLGEAGRRAEALMPAAEAVGLYRRLAGASPDAYAPDLAASLNNLATRLSEVGRRAEALAPAAEAVAIRRRLAGANGPAYEPDLAMSLNNLATMLSEVGRRAEALAPAEEAVAIRRRLAGANRQAYEPDLAASLNNLANSLSTVGRRAEALAPAAEAVGLYRRLAGASPDAHAPYLAGSLNNLATMLSAVGRRAEALAPAEEAVGLYRRLAGASPDAYEPDLAMSLNNLANRLSEVGRWAEAVAPADEAVAIRRRLAGTNPGNYEPDLAMSLNNLATMLSELGRRAEAIALVEEALKELAPHFTAMPGAHAPRMAWIAKAYIEHCEALQKDPDAELLLPIIAVFQSLRSVPEASEPEGESST